MLARVVSQQRRVFHRLGHCLSLLDAKFLNMVKDGYLGLVEAFQETGVRIPKNRRAGSRKELLLRDLDCAVINFMHQTRADQKLREFETVRAAFTEGGPLYPGSGFSARNHIQICVRKQRNIKGYSRPMDDPDLSA